MIRHKNPDGSVNYNKEKMKNKPSNPCHKPSARVIRDELKRLRKRIENPLTPACESRIAQAMEDAIRWATEETTWGRLSNRVKEYADLIAEEWQP